MLTQSVVNAVRGGTRHVGALLLAVAFGALALPASAQNNLLLNGSFEDLPPLVDWVGLDNFTFSGVICGIGGTYVASDGNCYFQSGAVPSTPGGLEPATLAQGLNTVIGQSYVIGFDFASDGGDNSFFSASFNGVPLFTPVVNPPAQGFTHEQFIVTANAAQSTLAFGFQDVSGFLGLDAVSVTLPEPGTVALLGLALAGVGLGRLRRKG